jgi:hypothetical protein
MPVIPVFFPLKASRMHYTVIPLPNSARLPHKCKEALLRMYKPKGIKGEKVLCKRLWLVGNEFVRLMAALIVCRAFGLKHLVLEKGSLFLKHSFTTEHGIFVDVGGDQTNGTEFQYLWKEMGLDHCPGQYWLDAARSIRHHIIRDLPKPNITDSTLVMHVRGGDIFPPAPAVPPNWYGQPMCQYYTDAMDKDRAKGSDRVIIVSYDRRNWCIPVCEKKGAVHVRGSLAMDFSTLVHAKRMVLSRSTFSRAAMYLSPVEKIWYNFGSMGLLDVSLDDRNHHIWTALGPHDYCAGDYGFEKYVVLRWRPDVYHKVLTDKCAWHHYTLG